MLAASRTSVASASTKMAARAVGATSSQHLEQRRTILGISKAIDRRLCRLAKGVMPSISKTKQIALGCAARFDRDIFGGNPSLKHLQDTYKPKLTAEEQSYLDNEVNNLCRLLNDHAISNAKDYMRDKGLFVLKIPKEWGGERILNSCCFTSSCQACHPLL
jgi:hypothetical protein